MNPTSKSASSISLALKASWQQGTGAIVADRNSALSRAGALGISAAHRVVVNRVVRPYDRRENPARSDMSSVVCPPQAAQTHSYPLSERQLKIGRQILSTIAAPCWLRASRAEGSPPRSTIAAARSIKDRTSERMPLFQGALSRCRAAVTLGAHGRVSVGLGSRRRDQVRHRGGCAPAAAAAAKDLHCVAAERSTDGSVLFRFSAEGTPIASLDAEAMSGNGTAQASAPAGAADAPAGAPEVDEPSSGTPSSDASVDVTPAVIIGGGRVGSALLAMGGGDDVLLKRGDAFPPASGYPGGRDSFPIIVCTRNDVLNDVVASVPPGRWKDLVFLQNGVIQPWIDDKGLKSCTQMLAYFAVAKLGDPPTDGVTRVNPEGLTCASGPWASEVAARLHAAGLSCHVLDEQEYQKRMYEKLIWICAFMAVGASHGGCTVGEVAAEHGNQLGALVQELGACVASQMGVTLDAGLEDRLLAYGESVSHFPTAVKEFEWRNGFFFNLSKKALKAGKEDPAPIHSETLFKLGVAMSSISE